jgi:hypothetical protein
VANAVDGESSFDGDNPLYGRRRDAETPALEATVLYSLPAESRRWQLAGGAFRAQGDSAIRLHDNNLTQVFLGVVYNFGQLPRR